MGVLGVRTGYTPVFGSQQNATNWNDRLRAVSSYLYFASVFSFVLTPLPGGAALNLRYCLWH